MQTYLHVQQAMKHAQRTSTSPVINEIAGARNGPQRTIVGFNWHVHSIFQVQYQLASTNS